MTIADLSPAEFTNLVRNAAAHKALVKGKDARHLEQLRKGMAGTAVAMMFSKRSTRTRVSTEAAVSLMGGHAMFLGKDDIQLGVSVFLLWFPFPCPRLILSISYLLWWCR